MTSMADSPELSAALTESLRQSPLLRDLSAAQVRAVIGAARLRQVARDGFLFQQGDLASALHLLLAGRLRILQVTPEGQQVLLRVVTPGEVCGGIGLLENTTRWPAWAAPCRPSKPCPTSPQSTTSPCRTSSTSCAGNRIPGDKPVKITDAFLGEHATLYAQFNYLEQATPAAEALAIVQSLAAGLNATLASHAHLEDELLFTALDPYLGPMGPLAVMRMEHDQIEGLLERIPAAQDLRQAQGLLQQTVQLARSHFAKEEQVLYPIAEQALDQARLAELAVQWAERRGVYVAR